MCAIPERLRDVSCIGAIQIDITFTFIMPRSILVCHIPYRSLGCTVVEMLSGKPPWNEYEGVAVIYCIGTCDKPTYRLPDSVSDVSATFLERCFVRDPLCRPSAAELLSDAFVCDLR